MNWLTQEFHTNTTYRYNTGYDNCIILYLKNINLIDLKFE